MRYLLDTCVLSETARPRPDARVLLWLESVDERDLYIPAVVFGELRKGVELRDDGAKKTALSKWLDDCFRMFSEKIVPFDYAAANQWGKMLAKLQKQGRTPSVIDSQIAATALRHGMMLVTRNVSDMANFGVEIVNPFQ